MKKVIRFCLLNFFLSKQAFFFQLDQNESTFWDPSVSKKQKTKQKKRKTEIYGAGKGRHGWLRVKLEQGHII